MSARKCGHVAVDDLLRQSFHDGRLADAWFPDQDGVVLRPAAKHLLDALELVLPADQRVELVLHGRLGQVAAELGKQRRLFDPRQRRLFVEKRDDVLADGIQAHPFFEKDGGRHRALLAQDPEQQVLGADVVVEKAIGFFGRKLQHALRFGAEGKLDRGRDLLAEDRPAFDFLPDIFERQMGAGKDPAGEAFAFANQTEEQVLGLNGDAPELTGLVTSKEEDSSGPFGVPFEHPAYLGESRWCWGHGNDDHIIRHSPTSSQPVS